MALLGPYWPLLRNREYMDRKRAGSSRTGVVGCRLQPNACLHLPQRRGRLDIVDHKPVFYVTQLCFRAGNQPSGPDFGRIRFRKTSKSAVRPAEGRPEGRFGGFFD